MVHDGTHIYCEEITRDYPVWLAKKMELGVNKLLNKETNRKRAGDDGSEFE